MDSDNARNETGSTAALPAFNPTNQPKTAPQKPLTPQRRHSLPLHYLPPGLWSANTSGVSLVESEAAARGEHILDEATAAHRISALRQLNGATTPQHRYAKSTGARNSTFSQPVIVRTYSGATRPRSEQRDIVTVKKDKGISAMAAGKMELKMPPVEAFTFKGIMEEIRQGVAEDLERIAEICARSKYSLSNQYEVHMPPHGRGEPILQTVGMGANGDPTLQAVGSDDESLRHIPPRSRGGRRTKSMAYGTLETIMSSSRSSDEDKTKKKPAAVIADEVRGRAAMKLEAAASKSDAAADPVGSGSKPTKHVRSKSASFASMIIENAHGFRHDSSSQLVSPTALISEPARPQTSGLDTMTIYEEPDADPLISPTLEAFMSPKPTLIRNESTVTTLRVVPDPRPSILGSLASWLPWPRPAASSPVPFQGRMRSASHAEGSLRELLKSTETDRKGKQVDRFG